MKLDDFAAGVNRLRPLLNPDKRGQYRAKELAQYLKESTPFLVSKSFTTVVASRSNSRFATSKIQVLKFAREDKAHPAALFAHNLLYTCDTIITELPAILHDPSFDGWELRMNERAGCIKIDDTTPLPAFFLSSLSQPTGRKRTISTADDSGDQDASGDDDDEAQGGATSGENGSDNESEEESDESEEEAAPKRSGDKGVPKPKAPSSGKAASTSGMTSQAKGAVKNQKKKASLPKRKFTTPKEPAVSLSITVPVGPPKKAPKTQPGSVKDEPVPMASSFRGARTSQHPKGQGEEKPVASSSKVATPATVMIKNKRHLAFGTHRYGREVPVPVKDEEIETIVQASIVPQYGCAQCSSSVQNQPCSLCSYRAEPVQRYHARKELAKFVEATPDKMFVLPLLVPRKRSLFVKTPLLTKERTLSEELSSRAVDFEEQLRVALVKVDRSSSIPLNTTRTSSFDQIVAQALSKPPLRNDSPSLPIVEGSGGVTTPARSQKVSVVPKDDSGDEVNALVDQVTSSPVRPPIESLKDA
ncbi:hypothetical protein EV421DRAFT_1904232 [Armillaria borealis]|uniref:Uncharacterized protein n=1 Tax=Armillaria borealis TaxID=47425 RepID=A0AA39JIM8_9AGAR|nr:hypothetical protein EV421DRAFT_1904232 [Armillaria borealis]